MSQSLSIEVLMDSAYDGALNTVINALRVEGFGILTRIDVQAIVKEKMEEEYHPYVILGACNPPYAFRSLAHEPRAGLLLPCNVIVEEAPRGGTLVRLADPVTQLEGAGDLKDDPTLQRIAAELREQLQRVAASLGKPAPR